MWLVFFLLFPLFLTAGKIEVKTKAPQNRIAVFHYRVPKGYDKHRREMYRVLVIFGGRNTDGKADASGRMGWGLVIDEIFIEFEKKQVCKTFIANYIDMQELPS